MGEKSVISPKIKAVAVSDSVPDVPVSPSHKNLIQDLQNTFEVIGVSPSSVKSPSGVASSSVVPSALNRAVVSSPKVMKSFFKEPSSSTDLSATLPGGGPLMTTMGSTMINSGGNVFNSTLSSTLPGTGNLGLSLTLGTLDTSSVMHKKKGVMATISPSHHLSIEGSKSGGTSPLKTRSPPVASPKK